MDSEHRHELKESDLVTAITTAKEWWAKHQMKVLTAAVVLAALILAIRYFSATANAAREGEQYELATAAGPDALRKLADTTSNESVKVQASLRGGDAILTLLRKPSTGADALTVEKKKQLTESGEALFKSALEDASHPLIRIKARFGLAAIAETRSEWKKAAEQYQAIQKEGGEGYEFLTKRAAAFEAALVRLQTEPIYGREVVKNPYEFGKDGKDDKDGKGFTPGGLNLLPEKDGKDAKDSKDPLFPIIPEPTKDAKNPPPVIPAPEKDAKPAPAPEKDAKPAPVPTPAPTKDAKPAPTPEKDAKAPTP